MAYGLGAIKGMSITFRHFVQSYLAGQNEQPAVAGNLPFPSTDTKLVPGMPQRNVGRITVEYPDEKLPVPERFRYLPFLVYDDDPEGERAAFSGVRCTACGICAKVCPPQCIWIVQGKGDDGRPRPVATEFTIDASICMSCGFCAEYCPFDAIKMDHEHEFTTYERHESWVFDLQELLHPTSYHAAIHPTDYRREVESKRAKEEAKRKKEEEKLLKAQAPSAGTAAGAIDADEANRHAIDADEANRRKMEARQQMLDARAKRAAEDDPTEAPGDAGSDGS